MDNPMKKKIRHKIGDRFDGVQIRDLDAMHIITSILYPNRCDNEAYISERIDMATIRAYCEKKNSEEGVLFPYTPFHIITTAVIKTLTLRPKLNRFIVNQLMYQRRWISVSFVVKKLFTDTAEEALAVIYPSQGDTVNDIHRHLYEQISSGKSDHVDGSTNAMNIVSKPPVRLVRGFVNIIRWLDRIGKCPRWMIETDPYYTTAVLSNVGSIKLKSGYHHLTNWGTTSLFCLIGEIKKTACLDENNQTVVKETVDLGLTVDERLADGYYYSKSVRLLKAILANPEVLELPMEEEIEY